MLTPYQRQETPADTMPNGALLAQALAPFLGLFDQWATEKFQQLLVASSAHVPTIPGNETMTRAELGAELGICDQTAMNWEKAGIIQSYRLGRRVIYKRAEVLAAMQAQTRPDGTRRNARRGKQQKTR